MQWRIQNFTDGCGGRGGRQSLSMGRNPIITGCNEVVAKVIFLHLSVILFTGGCLPQYMLGCHPPGADTPPSRHPPRQTPPRSRHPPKADPPRADTPPKADIPKPLKSRHPLPKQTPQKQTRPPPKQTPPRADTP